MLIIPYFCLYNFKNELTTHGGEIEQHTSNFDQHRGGGLEKHTSNHDQRFSIIIQSLGENDCAVNGSAARRSSSQLCAVSRLPEGVRGKQTAMCHQKMRLVGQEDLQDVWGLL